jgi:hypothetical protein
MEEITKIKERRKDNGKVGRTRGWKELNEEAMRKGTK